MLSPLVVQCVQQEEAHCGPATLAMLFSFYGLHISQTEIARAAGMSDIIHIAHGMRLDELNAAVQALFPDGSFTLLAKYHSSVDDVERIVDGFRLPIGVEWQGRFPRPDGSEYDQGHYSAIIGIDRDRNQLFIADPEDHNVLTREGVLAIDKFEDRWWEVDIVPKPGNSANPRVTEMERLIFVVVTQRRVTALTELGFKPAMLPLIWNSGHSLEPAEEAD